MSNVLFVDDDAELLLINQKYFQKLGFTVLLCSKSTDVIPIINKNSLDCIILDIMMPDIDGFALCKQIRHISNVPIIFLSGCTSEDERVNGLLIGADDYLIKPYSFRELAARIQLQIRKKKTVHESVMNLPPLKISIDQHKVWCSNQELCLSNQEFLMLQNLMEHPGELLTFEQIALSLWGISSENDRKTIMVISSRLRKKIEAVDPFFHAIESVRGKGYCFKIKHACVNESR